MKSKNILFILFLFLNQSFIYSQIDEPSYYDEKKLVFKDQTYESTIKTVLLFQNTGDLKESLLPAVLPLQSDSKLMLEFDDLTGQNNVMYAKIIHCNRDWTKSSLFDSEYLDDFNEFSVVDYSLSFSTKQKYTHYSFQVPSTKISGNFLLIVYRNGNQDDLVLSRRFLVYENQVSVIPEMKISMGIRERNTKQQIDFKINYGQYSRIANPQQEFSVMLRQNNRWDNAIYNLKPLFVNDYEKSLDYHFFNLENNFDGGNEFRVFDCRRLRNNATNVESVSNDKELTEISIFEESSRSGQKLTNIFDLDGKFIVGNTDMSGTTGDPDYVKVKLKLKSPILPYSIFIYGGLTDWKIDQYSKMIYNEEKQVYEGIVKVKQGFYNYEYVTLKDNKIDEVELEGSHFNAQNHYEIVVYHRAFGGRADFIVGYYHQNFNGL